MYARTEKNIACNWTVSLGQRWIILVKPVSQRAWECPLYIPSSFSSVSGEKHTTTFSCVPHFQVDQEEVSNYWQDFILYCHKSPCAGISMNFQWCWCYHDLWRQVFCLTQQQHPGVHIKSSIWVKKWMHMSLPSASKTSNNNEELEHTPVKHSILCINLTIGSAMWDFFFRKALKSSVARGASHMPTRHWRQPNRRA